MKAIVCENLDCSESEIRGEGAAAVVGKRCWVLWLATDRGPSLFSVRLEDLSRGLAEG
jgi:hypothetical protein